MRPEHAGRIVAVASAAALLALLAVEPPPMDEHDLARALGEGTVCSGVPPGATLGASRVRLATAGGHTVLYDEARNATLVATRWCSHQLASPALWIEGNHRGEALRGPLLLRPSGPNLTVEEVGDLGQPPSHPPGSVTSAVAGFRTTPVWPPFLAYVGLLALGLAGSALSPAGLRAGPWAAWLAVLAVAAGASLRGGWNLLAGLLSLVLVPLGIVAGGMTAWALLRRQRVPGWALVILVVAVGFLAAAWLAGRYFPPSGAGD